MLWNILPLLRQLWKPFLKELVLEWCNYLGLHCIFWQRGHLQRKALYSCLKKCCQISGGACKHPEITTDLQTPDISSSGKNYNFEIWTLWHFSLLRSLSLQPTLSAPQRSRNFTIQSWQPYFKGTLFQSPSFLKISFYWEKKAFYTVLPLVSLGGGNISYALSRLSLFWREDTLLMAQGYSVVLQATRRRFILEKKHFTLRPRLRSLISAGSRPFHTIRGILPLGFLKKILFFWKRNTLFENNFYLFF